MDTKLLFFYGTGIDDLYQAFIRVYDSNNIIYEGYTYNGLVRLNLEENNVYRVIGFLNGNIIDSFFYVSENKIYRFVFNNLFVKEKNITFLLTDANYKDLPIEKGEIILWQK